MATSNGSTDITLTKQLDSLLTLSTNGKYADRDYQFSIDVQGASAALTASASSEAETTAATGSGTNISNILGTKSTTEPSSGLFFRIKSTGSGSFSVATPGWISNEAISPASGTETAYYPVDAAAVSATGTNTVTPSASISGSHVTLSNTDNGISVTATGGGTASANAIVAVTAAGFVSEGGVGSTTIDASSSTTTASSYLSGVTLEAPASGTRSFSITVPNGDGTVTFTFTVDSSGNVVVE